MRNFTNYVFSVDTIVKENHKSVNRLGKNKAIATYLEDRDIELSLPFEHWYLNHTDRLVMFLENEHLADWLFNCKYNVEEESFAFPVSSFIINFPAGYKLGGIPIRSTMVSRMLPSDIGGRIASFRQYYQISQSKTILVPEFHRDGETCYFCMYNNKGPYEKIEFTVPTRVLPLVLNDFQIFNKSIDDKDIKNMIPQERISLFNHIRLVGAIKVYLNAFPDALKSGCPNTMRLNHQKRCPNGHTIGIHQKILHSENTVQGSKIPHFRCGHFRNLSSTWYKNKKGQVIWIKDSFIGKGFHPETVLDKTA